MSKITVDEQVLAMLVTVNEKKAAIKQSEKKTQWRTNCSIGRDPDNTHDRENIRVMRTPQELIDWYIFLLDKEQKTEQAAQELDLPLDSTWLSSPIAYWKEDLKSRAAELSLAQKKKELEDLDKRVNNLVTAEQRRAMELKAVQEMLDNGQTA